MGLPGAGKTTLSLELANKINAVHFNADEIRRTINKDLGFSHADRIEHARRMGILCDVVVRSGHYAIADFVCPTNETRTAFDASNSFVIWVDRTPIRDYIDTTRMFESPTVYDVRVVDAGSPEYWADKIRDQLKV